MGAGCYLGGYIKRYGSNEASRHFLKPAVLVKTPVRAEPCFFPGRWVFVVVLGKGRIHFGSIKANLWYFIIVAFISPL